MYSTGTLAIKNYWCKEYFFRLQTLPSTVFSPNILAL